MENYTEVLGIDRENANNLAISYSGYAYLLGEGSSDDETHLIASSFLIGAVYQSIIDPASARSLYWSAAQTYKKIGMPIWRVCDICSQKNKPETNFSTWKDEGTLDQEENFYIFLQNFDGTPEYFITSPWVKFDFSRLIPGINISTRLVLEVLLDSYRWSNNINKNKLHHFSDLLMIFTEIMNKQYLQDEFAWRNLEGAMLPFEPITLAILVVILKQWLKDNSFDDLLKHFEYIDERSKILLHISFGLINGE